MSMKLALCCLAKRENHYIDEWIQHHVAVGFDQIFIYDNNDGDYEYVGDRITNNKDRVMIVPWKFEPRIGMQEAAYTDCYRSYGKDYDFMAFLDVDEFLVMQCKESLKEKLEKTTAENIIIPWVVYTYSGLYSRDVNSSVVESFKETTPQDSLYVKSIVRTMVPSILERGCSVHGQYAANSYSDIDGNPMTPTVFQKNKKTYSVNMWKQFENLGGCRSAVINHYRFKSVDEFINFKLKNGCSNGVSKARENLIEAFLRCIEDQNEREKVEKYIRERYNKNV